jgi:hypothetical protein
VSASDRANGHFNILDFIRYREGGKFSKEAPAEFFPKRENVFKGVSWANATCAIVGNSGTLNVKPYGKTIDSHDIVIRMNQAPTAGVKSFSSAVASGTHPTTALRRPVRLRRNATGFQRSAWLYADPASSTCGFDG